jgi:hypothetical protein
VFTSSLVARRVESGDALRFGEDFPMLEDLECFGTLSRRGPAAFFDCETAWQHGHAGERISELYGVRRAEANLAVLDRVWGSNPEFMAAHGEEYRRVVEELRRGRVDDLILLGRLSEAREELARMQSPPVGQRLLTALPAPVVTRLLALRSWLRRRSKPHEEHPSR